MKLSTWFASVTIIAVLCSIYGGAGGISHPRYILDLHICSDEVFASGDPYGGSVYHVLDDLVDVTPSKPGKVYKNEYRYVGSVSSAYGYASSADELSCSDYHFCLLASLANLLGGCPMRQGAQIAFADCKLRYEPRQIDA
ncbi:hypothetical protein MLD38_009314 [Melastoma candidum]|uniref:Uncharacterized protein n=1 Tax=Melastoma candidum TaxID=119954 RepID=A0ACB9S072_9MYRT|nr:hypothetical protein MLD38_009314 [Melastoma candidum]